MVHRRMSMVSPSTPRDTRDLSHGISQVALCQVRRIMLDGGCDYHKHSVSNVLRCWIPINPEPSLVRTKRYEVIKYHSSEVIHSNELFTCSTMMRFELQEHFALLRRCLTRIVTFDLMTFNSSLESFLQTESRLIVQPFLRPSDVHGMSKVCVLHCGNRNLRLSMPEGE